MRELRLETLTPEAIGKADLVRLAKGELAYTEQDRAIIAGLLRFALLYLEVEGFTAQPSEAAAVKGLAHFALDWYVQQDHSRKPDDWGSLMSPEEIEAARKEAEEYERAEKQAALAANKVARELRKRRRLARPVEKGSLPVVRTRFAVKAGFVGLGLAFLLLIIGKAYRSAEPPADDIILEQPAKTAQPSTRPATPAPAQQVQQPARNYAIPSPPVYRDNKTGVTFAK